MEPHHHIKKDNPLHRLFKTIILIIILVFILMIYYFIYVEFFRPRDENLDYIFSLNSQKYIQLDLRVNS
jgi:hypothetical protein